MLLANGLDLRPHGLVGEGAKRQPQRRMLLFDGGDDRFGRPNRIAGLRAADALDLSTAGDGRLRVGVDWLLWRLQRAAGPVGAEGAGRNDDDLDFQRAAPL